MGDIVVLTPNTIQIMVYLSGCLTCSMCWVIRSQGRERVDDGKRAKVWSAFSAWDVSKHQMFSSNVFKHRFQTQAIRNYYYLPFKAILPQVFYLQHPKWGNFTHWCPHMAERGNSLKNLDVNIKSSCKLM